MQLRSKLFRNLRPLLRIVVNHGGEFLRRAAERLAAFANKRLADRATEPVPIVLLAPARFSTTTGWPRFSASLGAILRSVRAVPPPGDVATNPRAAAGAR